MSRPPVPATLVADIDAVRAKPGAFELFGQKDVEGSVGLLFNCPCGCGDVSAVTFDVIPRAPGDDQRWRWNGNREKPTLAPSLNKSRGCRWHGWLRAGVWEEC